MQVEVVGLFFLIAFVYSSVGFGGGSSYLAVLALFGVGFLELRAIALLCNITVVIGSAIVFWQRDLINRTKAIPIVIASVPAAFLGGYLEIGERTFFILLGVALLLASMAMFLQSVNTNIKFKPMSQFNNSIIGAGVGFLSGMVGIGGGIFLSPILHLFRWEKSIVIASTASVYILANSVAGLLGQARHLDLETMNISFILVLMFAVFLGGQLGVRISIIKFSGRVLRRITAVLVAIVAIRILIQYY